jgi:hypothetical protein
LGRRLLFARSPSRARQARGPAADQRAGRASAADPRGRRDRHSPAPRSRRAARRGGHLGRRRSPLLCVEIGHADPREIADERIDARAEAVGPQLCGGASSLHAKPAAGSVESSR